MANKMRWRYGDINPISMAVATEDAVEIGDLLFREANSARPASVHEDLGSEILNQRNFAAMFAGVAMQASPVGDVGPIRIATSGVFEFDGGTDTHSMGDYIGVSEAGSGTELEDQVVEQVSYADLAIGRVARTEASATSKLLVAIEAPILHHLPPPTAGFGGTVNNFFVPMIPSGAPQALSGAGAVNVTAFRTNVTSTGAAQALTLANGSVAGQLKEICHVVDGGSSILTPTSLSSGTTITFTTVGESALLMWNAAAWVVLRLWNTATPGTPPVQA